MTEEDNVPKLDPIVAIANDIIRKHVFPGRPEFDFGSAHKLALGLTPLANKVSHAELTKTARETSGYGDLRDIDHVEIRSGVRVQQPSTGILRKHVINSIGHTSVRAVISSADGSPLKFPQVPGVSQETLALIHRQEAWPVESSGDELTARLEERKRVINEYALLDPFHAKLYPRRIKFAPGFMDTLEGHLADIERMRLRKRAHRRKATKKRKQRLKG